MIFWKPMVILMTLVGCGTPSIDLSEAVMLEQQGDDVGALNRYLQIIEDNPNSLYAQNAQRYVQRIHLKTAKKIEQKDPHRARPLYEKIVSQWPNSDYALVAQGRLDALSAASGEQEITKAIDSAASQPLSDTKPEDEIPSTSALSNEIVDEAELAACETARKGGSRIVWQQYKQNFPAGACLEEAEQFLKVVTPRALEIEQAQKKAETAWTSLKSLCVEYRLPQTTSDDNACQNPSRALNNEFARLLRRKADLLKDGDAEKTAYYQKFVPPRWAKLSQGKTDSCAPVTEYLTELARSGVDVAAVKEQLGRVATCFKDHGSIE